MLMRQWAALVSRWGPSAITPTTRRQVVAAIHPADASYKLNLNERTSDCTPVRSGSLTPCRSTFTFSATSDPERLTTLQENPRQETAVPSGKWLELARRNLRDIEGIRSSSEVN